MTLMPTLLETGLHGATYRQIDYWVKLGLLPGGNPGSGNNRDYSLITKRKIDALTAYNAVREINRRKGWAAITEEDQRWFLAELEAGNPVRIGPVLIQLATK